MRKPALLLVAFALVPAACGGSSDDGVASLDAETGAAAETDERSFEESLLDFTQCLREEGLDVPDPEFDEDGNLRFQPGGGPGGDQDIDIDELLAARDACSEFLVGISLDRIGIDQTALEDNLLAYAECMRGEGFDLPDPDLGSTLRRVLGQGEQNPEGVAGIGPFGDIDFEDPDFIAADAVCRPETFTQFDDGFAPPPGDS
jgi:hypothetical protein